MNNTLVKLHQLYEGAYMDDALTKLHRLIEQTSWTQKHLAELLKVDQSQLSKYLSHTHRMPRRIREAVTALYKRVIDGVVLVYAYKDGKTITIDRDEQENVTVYSSGLSSQEAALAERVASFCDPVNGNRLDLLKATLEENGYTVMFNFAIPANHIDAMPVHKITGRFDDDYVKVLWYLPHTTNSREDQTPYYIQIGKIDEYIGEDTESVAFDYFDAVFVCTPQTLKQFKENPGLFALQDIYNRISKGHRSQ